jgi:hypothetical protein
MARRIIPVALDDDAKASLDRARTAITELRQKLKNATQKPQGVVNSDLGISKSGVYDSWKSSLPRHLALSRARRFVLQFREFGTHPPLEYEAACAAHHAQLRSAIEALNAFIVIAGGVPPLEPVANYYPFRPHFEALPVAASPGYLIPLPTLDDYENMRVPGELAHEIKSGLFKHDAPFPGVVEVRGAAASGKTTAAFATAFNCARDQHACFYIDVGAQADEQKLMDAFARLLQRGPKILIVLDNAHRNLRLLAEILAQRELIPRNTRAKILIVSTLGVASGAEVVAFASRVSLLLAPVSVTARFLRKLAKFYVWKFGNRKIEPPDEAVDQWFRQFGSHLHAFTFAVMDGATRLGKRGDWILEERQAHEWLLHHWLKPARNAPSSDELENLKCISVFGSQELELQVPVDALPHTEPAHRHSLLQRGIVMETRDAAGASTRRFHLVEPGWGELILGALAVHSTTRVGILLEAASRSPALATALDERLIAAGNYKRAHELRRFLLKNQEFIEKVAGKHYVIWGYWARLPSFATAIRTAFRKEYDRGRYDIGLQSMQELSVLLSMASSPDIMPLHQIALATIADRLRDTKKTLVNESLGTYLTMNEVLHGMRKTTTYRDALEDQIKNCLLMLQEVILSWHADLKTEKMGTLFLLIQCSPSKSDIRAHVWNEIDRRITPDHTTLARLPIVVLLQLAEKAKNDGKDNIVLIIVDSILSFINDKAAASVERLNALLHIRRSGTDALGLHDIAITAIISDVLSDSFPLSELTIQHIIDLFGVFQKTDNVTALNELSKRLEQTGDIDRLIERSLSIKIVDVEHLIDTLPASGSMGPKILAHLSNNVPEVFQICLDTNIAELATLFRFVRQRLPAQLIELESFFVERAEDVVSCIRASKIAEIASASRRRISLIDDLLAATLNEAEWNRRFDTPDEHLTGGGYLAANLVLDGATVFGGALARRLAERANKLDVGRPLLGQVWKVVETCSDKALAEAYLQRMLPTVRVGCINNSFDQLANGVMALSRASIHRNQLVESQWTPSLIGRIRRHLKGNDFVSSDLKSDVISDEFEFIRLLGAFSVMFEPTLIAIDLPGYAHRLPWEQLLSHPKTRHRDQVSYVESYQYQFWLGLRLVRLHHDRDVPIDCSILEATRRRWQENERHSAETKPHDLESGRDSGMIAWLNACLCASRPALVYDRNPSS